MCFNPTVSVLAFVWALFWSLMIIGQFATQYAYAACIALGVLFLSLMQIVDFGIYRGWSGVLYAGAVLVALQPILAYGLFILFDTALWRRILATILVLGYTTYLLSVTTTTHLDASGLLTECGHIDYNWLRKWPYMDIMWNVMLYAMIFLLIPDIVASSIIVGLLIVLGMASLLALMIYGQEYRMPSVWCCIALVIPCAMYIYFLIKSKNEPEASDGSVSGKGIDDKCELNNTIEDLIMMDKVSVFRKACGIEEFQGNSYPVKHQ